MKKSDFPMKHLMIVGLLAAIGIVVLAGQSHAGSRYCSYYPEDPNCYDTVYGQGDYGQGGSFRGPEHDHNGEDIDEAYGSYQYQPQPRPRPMVRPVTSCEGVGRSLRLFGYSHVRAVECGVGNYKYVAYLGYQRFMVNVNSRNGAIAYEINY